MYEWFVTFLNDYAKDEAYSTLRVSDVRDIISYFKTKEAFKSAVVLNRIFDSLDTEVGKVEVAYDDNRILNDIRAILKKIIEQEEDEIKKAFLKARKLIFVTKINDNIKIVRLVRTKLTKNLLPQIYVLHKSFKRPPKTFKSIIFNFHKVGYDDELLKIYKAVASNPDLLSSALEMIKNRIPYVEDIRQVIDESYVYVHENKIRAIPLHLMGDGFINLIRLALLTALARDGIILLEEPEISLHPGFIDILADAIMAFSNYTQFFISTHSAELIQAILEKGKEKNKLNKINVVRLFKHEDLVDREMLSGDDALDEIETIETDLRGY
ncbi:MAG: AAA family ATPase [Candidatus Asgardarchaeia archaeon]